MTTYTAELNEIETLAEEMSSLGQTIYSIIEQLTADCNASLASWAGNAQSVYHQYATQWTQAAQDLPVQAANGQKALTHIIESYMLAEQQGAKVWTP
jgi:WXG100 family type VII secretion target